LLADQVWLAPRATAMPEGHGDLLSR